jgi:hypothetical protein
MPYGDAGVACAMSNSPGIEELIANRHKIVHEMYDPETGESQWQPDKACLSTLNDAHFVAYRLDY